MPNSHSFRWISLNLLTTRRRLRMVCYPLRGPTKLIPPPFIDGLHYPPRSAPNQMSHFSDSSVPLFTLYLRAAEGHDAKRLKLLKGDIDQILVFVSPCVGYPITHRLINSEAIVRFVLRHSCGTDRAVDR